jgi:hypothetical protein
LDAGVRARCDDTVAEGRRGGRWSMMAVVSGQLSVISDR